MNEQQVPTDIYEYCGWLNDRERRRGRWVVAEVDGQKAVDWREEIASDGWLRERSLIPQIGRAA